MAGGSSTMPKQLEQSVLFEVANVGEKMIPPLNLTTF